MADNRRTPPRGDRPRGRTGPGRVAGSVRGGRTTGSIPAQRPPSEELAPRRSRLTGRAAILVLVVAVLTVSYASSLRAFLDQRSEINDLKEQIAQRSASIDDLEREKARWDDPAYVRSLARERLNYVMPGETSYVVLDENGEPLQSESQLSDPDQVFEQEPEAWWGPAWESVKLAGKPPQQEAPPLTEIDGSKESSGE